MSEKLWRKILVDGEEEEEVIDGKVVAGGEFDDYNSRRQSLLFIYANGERLQYVRFQ